MWPALRVNPLQAVINASLPKTLIPIPPAAAVF